MNERIKELTKQAEKFYVVECTASASHFTAKGYVPKQFLQKFVELIVKECIDIAHSEGDDVAYLVHHLGVEK